MTDKEQMMKEWFWYDEHKIDPFPGLDKKFTVIVIDKTEYMLTHIPEEGLWGHYYGQGDLRWAWVRLDVWKKWVSKSYASEYEQSCIPLPAPEHLEHLADVSNPMAQNGMPDAMVEKMKDFLIALKNRVGTDRMMRQETNIDEWLDSFNRLILPELKKEGWKSREEVKQIEQDAIAKEGINCFNHCKQAVADERKRIGDYFSRPQTYIHLNQFALIPQNEIDALKSGQALEVNIKHGDIAQTLKDIGDIKLDDGRTVRDVITIGEFYTAKSGQGGVG